MTEQEGFEEAVLTFGAGASASDSADNTVTPAAIVSEMRFAEFESLINGAATLEAHAASIVRAAYAVVGAALSVRGMVFFTFRVDEDGRLDPSFNLPLRYLVENAGAGPDLGAGPIRLACRGQCPVPWHAVNLWEPVGEGEDSSIHLVQKSIWRNRLSLRPTGSIEKLVGHEIALEDPRESHRQMEERLTETFGEEGKVSLQSLIRQHSDQLSSVTSRYRSEIEQQQQVYLDQIRGCRNEIQKLKSALRHEQERSRRLQALLRGEP